MDNVNCPRIIHRACGGWLVASPAGEGVQIGVVAPSESEALSLYGERMDVWRHMLTDSAKEAGRVTSILEADDDLRSSSGPTRPDP